MYLPTYSLFAYYNTWNRSSFFKKIREFLFIFIFLMIVNFIIALFHSLVERGIIEYEINGTRQDQIFKQLMSLETF